MRGLQVPVLMGDSPAEGLAAAPAGALEPESERPHRMSAHAGSGTPRVGSLDWPMSRQEKQEHVRHLYELERQAVDDELQAKEHCLRELRQQVRQLKRASRSSQGSADPAFTDSVPASSDEDEPMPAGSAEETTAGEEEPEPDLGYAARKRRDLAADGKDKAFPEILPLKILAAELSGAPQQSPDTQPNAEDDDATAVEAHTRAPTDSAGTPRRIAPPSLAPRAAELRCQVAGAAGVAAGIAKQGLVSTATGMANTGFFQELAIAADKASGLSKQANDGISKMSRSVAGLLHKPPHPQPPMAPATAETGQCNLIHF